MPPLPPAPQPNKPKTPKTNKTPLPNEFVESQPPTQPSNLLPYDSPSPVTMTTATEALNSTLSLRTWSPFPVNGTRKWKIQTKSSRKKKKTKSSRQQTLQHKTIPS